MQKLDPKDNAANIQNSNKGTPGTNLQYDQNQGNRGKQLNLNQVPASLQEAGKLNPKNDEKEPAQGGDDSPCDGEFEYMPEDD